MISLLCSLIGIPPLSPSLEVNLTLNVLRNKIKGIKISIILIIIYPFIFIDILRNIPKVYLLAIITSSLLLIL